VSHGAPWDAICVGAGITSLAFGAQLVKKHPGTRLLLVDKHAVPGGYATVFHRPKGPAVFDCSLHKLSGMGEGGNLQRIFGELGLERELGLKVPEDYFEAVLAGETLTLGNDPEHVRHALRRRFPDEAEAIDRFFAEVDTHGRNGYYQFQLLEGSYEADFAELRYAHRHLKKITVSAALAARFRDPYLRELIAATGIYVGGYPEDLGYLYFLHVVYATLHKGNAYVRGASQRLSDVLTARIVDAGGAIMLGTNVQRILHDGAGQVTGVETAKGCFFAPRVYVNAAPHYAVGKLFDGGEQMAAVAEKLKLLRPSRSTTTVYATTDVAPGALGLASTETMVLGAGQDEAVRLRNQAALTPQDEAANEHAFWRCSPMEVTNYHALEPDGGHAICLNILDSIAHWPERKAPGYKAKKQRAAELMMDRLYAAKPGLRGHVNYVEVSSPRTYQRFTNNTDGAGYGAMIGTDLAAHLFHHNFPLKGVHFLSAWVAGPSYEAAFGYAEMKVRQWA
jgi:phytoene dehydrogenase-like protein